MGDFERTFGRTSDEPGICVTDQQDEERLPTPIPPMPDGMSEVEMQLFQDLRAAADNMADLLGVRRDSLLSDWVLFMVIATMPTTDDEMNKLPAIWSANCTSDFVSLVNAALVKREAMEAASMADQKAREEKIANREREVKAAMLARQLDQYVAAGVFPPHGVLKTRD